MIMYIFVFTSSVPVESCDVHISLSSTVVKMLIATCGQQLPVTLLFLFVKHHKSNCCQIELANVFTG